MMVSLRRRLDVDVASFPQQKSPFWLILKSKISQRGVNGLSILITGVLGLLTSTYVYNYKRVNNLGTCVLL